MKLLIIYFCILLCFEPRSIYDIIYAFNLKQNVAFACESQIFRVLELSRALGSIGYEPGLLQRKRPRSIHTHLVTGGSS